MSDINQKRCGNLVDALEEKEINGAFITCDAHVFYYSGFTGDDTQLLIVPDGRYLFTDSRYTEQAESQAAGFDVIETGRSDRYLKINEKLKKHDVSIIGIENEHVTLLDFDVLQSSLYVDGFQDISAILKTMRIIKSREEITIMSEGAKISDAVFSDLLTVIRAGISEMDIFTEMTYRFNQKGCELSFRPIVAGGENGALPHAPLTSRVLINGDLLTLDFGCKYKNYCTDCTRTIAIGGLDSEQKKGYDIVKIAQKSAFEAIKPGISARDLDATARSIIEDAGYGANFGHGLGHGVGLFIHEAPTLSPLSDEIIEENMVITIEPGVYFKGRFGIRIEDMCLVGKDGGISFNKLSRNLIII